MMRLLSAVVVLVFVGACGGTVGSVDDAGPADGAVADGAESGDQDTAPDTGGPLPDAALEIRPDEINPVPQSIRVASFNLRNGMTDDGPDSWELRADLLVQVFADLDADLVGVQEAWFFQLDYIQLSLPEYQWVGIARSGFEFDEYCAIFYRADRFEELETGTFWLSETPDEPGSKFPEQALPRICTWVRLAPLDGGPEVWLFNTHLTHLNLPEVREASAALILQRITALAGTSHAILTGDFNTGPGSAAWELLAGEGGPLLDTWPELGLPEEGTFHGFNGQATSARIDWILHGPAWTALDAAVVKDNEDGSYPSDHFPVVATLNRLD